MSDPRAICSISASRHWPLPARLRLFGRLCRWRGAARHDARLISPNWSRQADCRSMPISKADMPTIRKGSRKVCDCASRPESRDCRSRIPPATRTAALPFEQALSRIKAARAAIDKARGEDVMLPRAPKASSADGRTCEEIRRLKAFAEAGADCLYAPGIKTQEEIKAVVDAVAPKPVNILIGWPTDMSVRDWARSVRAGSASAVRLRAPPGADHARRTPDRRWRQLRRLCRCDACRRPQCFFQRGPKEAAARVIDLVTDLANFEAAPATPAAGRADGPLWQRRET